MWCIPARENASFVAQMEQVLEVYSRAYDPRFPVVCMDEQPKQLLRESRPPVTGSDAVRRIDHEYIREGVCNVWMFTEPLGGWRDVRVSPRRRAVDWAHQIKELVDAPRYAQARRILLVCDNLSTHKLGSLYEAFEAAEALRIAEKIELVFTPKHGSWLNMAECELSVLTRQCLSVRMAELEQIGRESRAWSVARNGRQIGIDWQFSTQDARRKLKRLYPKIEERRATRLCP